MPSSGSKDCERAVIFVTKQGLKVEAAITTAIETTDSIINHILFLVVKGAPHGEIVKESQYIKNDFIDLLGENVWIIKL